MVANTRDDVATLNALAKNEAATAGLLDVAGPSVRGREGQQFHVGDRVVARQNAPAFRHIVNGDLGTITTIDDHGRVAMLRDRDGVTVMLPKRYVTESLDLGYATTRHQAQGATYEATHVLHGDGGSHEGGYVVLSRSRGDTTLYAAETLTPAGECTHHIAPDASDPLHRIIDDLTRSALDPSASERGYGVTARSDAELVAWRNQLAGELRQSPLAVDLAADLAAVRDALEQNPAPLQAQAPHSELQRLEARQAGRLDWVEHNSDTVATYQAIAAELEERHHTLTAINQLDPPAEILTVLGPKPDDPATLGEWRRAVASYSKDSIQVPHQTGQALHENPAATEWRNAAQRYQTRTQLIEARRPTVPAPIRAIGP